MSTLQSSPGRGEGRAVGFDADLAFLRRFAGPVVLLARAMMAYIHACPVDAYTPQG